MFRLFAELVDRFRWLWLCLLILATAAAAFAATGVRYDFRPQTLFAGNDDLIRYAEEVRETFGREDTVLLIVAEATGQRDVLDRELLTWQARVSKAIQVHFKQAEVPQIRDIKAIVLMRMPRPKLLPPWPITAMVRSLPVSDSTEQRLREIVNESDLLKGNLISEDLRLSAIAVTVSPEARKIERMKSVMRDIGGILQSHPVPTGYNVHRSGLPTIRVDIVEHMKRDQIRLLPLVTLLFVVVLTLVFRQFVGALLPLLAVGTGLIWTVGVLAASGQSFNLISNILPLLLLIIGVSNSVHVVSRFIQEAGETPNDRRAATRRTMRHMAVACLLASVTTAIGFLSIAAARSEVLRNFGWQAAVGMGLLYLSTMLVLGIALPWFRPVRRQADTISSYSPISHTVAIAGYTVARHPWPVFLVSLAVLAASLWVGRGCIVNSYLLESYDADNPTLQTMRMLEDRMAGVIPLEVILDADQPQLFLAPENYTKIHKFETYALKKFAAVTLAQSYVDLYQAVYQNSRRTAADRYRMPSLDAEGQRRIKFCAEAAGRWAGAFNYRAYMTEDGCQARILLRMTDLGTHQLLQLIDDLEAKLGELFPADSGIQFQLTGDSYVSAKAMDRFIRDIFYSLGAAAVVIFAIIGVLFRSLRLGLVAALPNMTPLAITLGYMGLRGYDLNTANMIVFSISLGIAVDNTIHFLARFREEIRQADDVALAVERTYEGTGKAIVLTTFLIIAGLSVLSFSEFVPTRRVAELITVSMAAALIGDLLLLPACLVLFWKGKPSPISDAAETNTARA